MFNLLESKFLKHLDAICEKYEGIDDEDDKGIDITLLDEPNCMNTVFGARTLRVKAPKPFSFAIKGRDGNNLIKRFRFVDVREEFNRLYRISLNDPTLDDLYWITDSSIVK